MQIKIWYFLLGSFYVYHEVVAQDPGITPRIITPVLPWEGTKLFGETDCTPWIKLAELIRSDLHPDKKKVEMEKKACKLSHGLECLSGSVDGKEGGALKDICKCMINMGVKPKEMEIDEHTECFIPAGLGWHSQCYFDYKDSKTVEIGFPLPYGDPKGSGPDPPYETDEKNSKSGDTSQLIHYLKWNSISLRCVPNSQCRTGSNYIGLRCQCNKGSAFDRLQGTCSFATKHLNDFMHIKLLSIILLILYTCLS